MRPAQLGVIPGTFISSATLARLISTHASAAEPRIAFAPRAPEACAGIPIAQASANTVAIAIPRTTSFSAELRKSAIGG